jgi:phospholipid/cholesterol/gamma-HCH transport system substrate-binding protein
MSDSKRRNALIGLFVLGGLVALGVLIVKFGESKSWFGQRYEVRAKFDRINGVREGTQVQLAGVWIGQVAKVDLAERERPDEGVIVVMEVDKKYLVPRGSVANVIVPLMGQASINIIPPQVPTASLPLDGTGVISGKIVNPLEQVIDPKMMATLEKTTAQIGTLAEALTPAANDIHVLLKRTTTQEVDQTDATANLFTAVERLHSVMKHIDSVLGDPNVQGNIKSTVDNFRLASEDARLAVLGFKAFSQTAQQVAVSAQGVVGKLDTTVMITQKHIDELGQKLTDNSDRLSKFLDYMVSAGQNLAEGQGTLGLMLRDPRFYEELLLTVQRLGMAAADLQVTVKQWQEAGLMLKLR